MATKRLVMKPAAKQAPITQAEAESYARRSLERMVRIGALAQTVLAIAAEGEHSLERALQYVTDQETRALLSNQYRGGSSSDFHNATDAAKREGSAQFLDQVRWLLREFADARAFATML